MKAMLCRLIGNISWFDDDIYSPYGRPYVDTCHHAYFRRKVPPSSIERNANVMVLNVPFCVTHREYRNILLQANIRWVSKLLANFMEGGSYIYLTDAYREFGCGRRMRIGT